MDYIVEPHKYFEIIFNPSYEVTSALAVSEKTMCVTYKVIDDYQKPCPSSALMHALQVTSYSRCLLFELVK